MSWKRISATLLGKFNSSSDADKTTDISKSVDQFRKVGRSSFVFIEKVQDNTVERQEIILLSDESTTCEEVAERSNGVNCDDITNSNIEILKRKTESNENVLTEDEVVISDNSDNSVVENVCQDNIKRDQMMRVDELIETEKTYVNQLHHVVQYYMPLIQAERGVPQTLTLLQPEDVFCNIKAIHKFHKKTLLPALIEAGYDIKAIGNVFIQNIDSLLVLYEIYSNKKKKSDKVIEEHSKFFEKKQEEFYDDFDISTYITTPLQRITRYPTFLESMVKDCQRLNDRIGIITSNHTEISTNDDAHTLQNALESVAELLKILNKKSTLLVGCFGLKDLQVISELQGTYVRHDVFHVSDSCNQRRPMTCFLFEKSLILAVKLNQKVSADDIYKHYDRLPIKYLGYILSLDEETNYLTVWYHDNISRQYVLEGEMSIKNNWFHDINLVMCQQLNNELYKDLFQQFRIFHSM